MLKMRKAAILILMLLLAWSSICTLPVYAAENERPTVPMIGIADEWDGLEGDARYLGQEYRNNYILDQKAGKLDLTEKAANGLANVFWKICTLGTQVGCAVIYYAMDFNLSELVGDKLNALEATLVDNVFNRIFPIAFIGVGCMLIIRLWKRDVIGGFSDIAKTTILVCISIALSINASSILTLTSSLTKQVNQTIMSGINGQAGFSTNQDDFAKEAAGILWTDMIHIPWMTIEFGTSEVSEENVQRILASKGEERTDIINELADEMDCFSTDRCWERLAYVLLYLFPWVSKLVVFSLISALQLAFQAAVLLLFSTAPIVLIVALLSASGFYLIKQWGSALLDFHIDMIMLSFLLSILIWIDKLLFTVVSTYGWLIVALLQTAICVFVFLKRNKILGFLIGPRGHGVQDIVENVGNQMRDTGNQGVDFLSQAAGDVRDSVHDIKDYQEESVINAARNTTFSEAYNEAEYVDEEDDTQIKYYSTEGSASEEVNDSDYRKGAKTMTPQEVYESFHDPEYTEETPSNVETAGERERPEEKKTMEEDETDWSANESAGQQYSSMDGMDEDDDDEHIEKIDMDRPNAYGGEDADREEKLKVVQGMDSNGTVLETVNLSESEEDWEETTDSRENEKTHPMAQEVKEGAQTEGSEDLEKVNAEHTVFLAEEEKLYNLNEEKFAENDIEIPYTTVDSNEESMEEIENGKDEQAPQEYLVVE